MDEQYTLSFTLSKCQPSGGEKTPFRVRVQFQPHTRASGFCFSIEAVRKSAHAVAS